MSPPRPPPPPQALLAAGEGVRGLSRNGKVAQHCSAFRLLSHSLDPLPVPGFSRTFQATSSAHFCVLGFWLRPPPAESPLPMWGLFVSALHPPSTLSVDSWLLPAFVQRLGQIPPSSAFIPLHKHFPSWLVAFSMLWDFLCVAGGALAS